MQNRVTEIKNSQEATNSRIYDAEEWISDVANRLVEITDVEKKSEKRLKRNEDSLGKLWDNVKCTNFHIIWCQKEKRENKGQRKYLKK